jgi:hypothetical protein
VDALEGQRQLLSELQADAGLGAWNDALLLDLRLAGIVEAWAAGATWQQVRLHPLLNYELHASVTTM